MGNMHLEDTVINNADHKAGTDIEQLAPLSSFRLVDSILIDHVYSSRASKERLNVELFVDPLIFSAIKHSILIFKNSCLICCRILNLVIKIELTSIKGPFTLCIRFLIHFLVRVNYLSHLIFLVI